MKRTLILLSSLLATPVMAQGLSNPISRAPTSNNTWAGVIVNTYNLPYQPTCWTEGYAYSPDGDSVGYDERTVCR
jgi:hypothetical protein